MSTFIRQWQKLEYNTACYAYHIPSLRRNTHDSTTGPLCESITSSTKLEVCITTLPEKDTARAIGNVPKNLVKLGLVVLCYASRQTDRQTDRHANHSTLYPARGHSSNNSNVIWLL